MDRYQGPHNDQLPLLQQGLSRLSPSDWVHQLRVAIADVTDFSVGPVVTWTERHPWGHVQWGIDTSYGMAVPRPEHAAVGHVFVREVLVWNPAAGPVARRQVQSSVTPLLLRRGDGSVVGGAELPVQLGGTVTGGAGVLGGGSLASGLGFTSLPLMMWGAAMGVLAGVGAWTWWRHRGRRQTRTWRAEAHDADVPEDLATISVLHAQLWQAAGWVNDESFMADLHRQLDRYRWELLDPDRLETARGNLDRLAATIADLVASAQEAGEREAGRHAEILDELQESYPIDTVMGDDGVAEQLQARIAALRELHDLDERKDDQA